MIDIKWKVSDPYKHILSRLNSSRNLNNWHMRMCVMCLILNYIFLLTEISL